MFTGFSQLLIFGFTYFRWPRRLVLSKIITRSGKQKQWIKSKATVEEDRPLQEGGSVCSCCQPMRQDQECLMVGTQPQTVTLRSPSAAHPSSSHPLQFFPILWGGNRRPPAPLVPSAPLPRLVDS